MEMPFNIDISTPAQNSYNFFDFELCYHHQGSQHIKPDFKSSDLRCAAFKSSGKTRGAPPPA